MAGDLVFRGPTGRSVSRSRVTVPGGALAATGRILAPTSTVAIARPTSISMSITASTSVVAETARKRGRISTTGPRTGPGTSSARQRRGPSPTRPAQQPSASRPAQQPSMTRPSTGASGSWSGQQAVRPQLERDFNARQRGASRTQSFQRQGGGARRR